MPPNGLPNLLGDILILDHTSDRLEFLPDLLIAHGYKVRQVSDINLVIQAAIDSPPDLILLKATRSGKLALNTPFELLKQYYQPHTAPILVLDSEKILSDGEWRFQSGIADGVIRLLDPIEIVHQIELHLKLSRLQHQLVEQNEKLQQAVNDRIAVQAELQALTRDLEAKVQARTTELNERNEELLRLQAQLENALLQNQRLNNLKSELISTISHEFRTPLSVITLSAKLLKHSGSRQEGGDRYFQNISDSVHRMQQMLDNAITLSQAKADTIPFEPRPLLLTEFCQMVVSSWKLPAESSHQLMFQVQGTAPAQVSVDSALLQQILTQLISNAIRYSPKGGIVLVELVYASGIAILRVHDQGIGIPLADQGRVFDHFYRASNASTIPGTPGAGLGLAVVKWAVDLHRGSIAIESEEGKGTTVSVSLPIG